MICFKEMQVTMTVFSLCHISDIGKILFISTSFHLQFFIVTTPMLIIKQASLILKVKLAVANSKLLIH